jgi:hypothetical protein
MPEKNLGHALGDRHGVSTGRHGGRYGYFFCMGRPARKTGCTLPHLQAHSVDDAVVQRRLREEISDARVQALREALRADLAHLLVHHDADR